MEVPAFDKDEFEGSDACYQVINSVVVPRPVAFVTSKGENGVINAAPFSYFNVVCSSPTVISIAIARKKSGRKDTVNNIAFFKEFVINICSFELVGAVAVAGGEFPPEVSEIEVAKLSLLDAERISVPRIANTPVQLECKLYQMVEVAGQCDLILGEVVRIHVHKGILNERGEVDPEKLNPLARISGSTYAKVGKFFSTS